MSAEVAFIQQLTKEKSEHAVRKAKERKQESRLTSSKIAIKTALKPCALVLEQFIAESGAKDGRPTRYAKVIPYLQQLAPEATVFVALVTLFNGISEPQPVTRLAIQMGAAVEQEVRWDCYQEQMPGFFNWILDKHLKSHNVRYRKTAMTSMMNRKGAETVEWSKEVKLMIGSKLLSIFIDETGFIFEELRGFGKNQKRYIAPTHEFLEWSDRINKEVTCFRTFWSPATNVPNEWKNQFQIPYRRAKGLPKIPLVNNRNKEYLHTVKVPRKVKEAVNYQQSVSWVINEPILDIMKTLVAKGLEVSNLVGLNPIPKPPRPEGDYYTDPSVIEWRKIASEINHKNIKTVSQRITQQALFAVADEFKGKDIWFPYNADFRGRIYSIPRQLHPQGSDIAKGLLKFAKGEPLDNDRGIFWFEVHGANLWGYDKDTFQGRVQWVRANEQNILNTANHPLDFNWWHEADKPFQFLAWCFEYRDWLNCEDPYSFVSHIPVAMDGSCSGLQHYSAMLRDEEGAKYVNVSPSDKPADIYQRVADLVKASLEQQTHEPMAMNWLRLGFDRKLTKKAVMTTVYGSKPFGWRKDILDWLEERELPWDDKETKDHVTFIAREIKQAIEGTVVKASDAMVWLRDVARLIVKQTNEHIEWRTPLGLIVHQYYPVIKSTRVDTHLFGKLRLNTEVTDQVCTKNSASGFPPNFIHSMDSTHLLMTLLELKERGIHSVSTVHDSFAVHARYVDELHHALRYTFVELYSGFSLDKLKADLELQYKVTLPDPPSCGTLDLTEVYNSQFLFS